MHCEARRLCLHTFNYAGAFVGEARRICLHTLDYAGAFVGEARRFFFLPLQQSSGDHDGRALTKTTDAITT